MESNEPRRRGDHPRGTQHLLRKPEQSREERRADATAKRKRKRGPEKEGGEKETGGEAAAREPDRDRRCMRYLNLLLGQPAPPSTGKAGRPQTGGRQMIAANAKSVRDAAEVWVPHQQEPMLELGLKPCLLSRNSRDGSGRPQFSMRVRPGLVEGFGGKEGKANFRPHHVAWMDGTPEGRPLPLDDRRLQYSHRCHNGDCVEESHGVWETDRENKSRNYCQNGSHVFLPDGHVIVICPHSLPCLVGVRIDSWDDPRVQKIGPKEGPHVDSAFAEQ